MLLTPLSVAPWPVLDSIGVVVVLLDGFMWVRGCSFGVWAAGFGPCFILRISSVTVFRSVCNFVFVCGLYNEFAGSKAFLPLFPVVFQFSVDSADAVLGYVLFF